MTRIADIDDLFDVDTSSPIPIHRFTDSSDIISLFQHHLDRFPETKDPKNPRFGEFGCIFIRPKDEPLNRLTHAVFPDTVIAFPNGGRSLRNHSDIAFPQARLAVSGDCLHVIFSSDVLSEDSFAKRRSAIAPMRELSLTTDLWNYFSKKQQAFLRDSGFHDGLAHDKWAEMIANYEHSNVERHKGVGSVPEILHILPFPINQRGHVGTLQSYYQMPGSLVWALLENTFKEHAFFEIGTAHIHPEKEFAGLSEQLASRVGERVTKMTISPSDVAVWRGTFLSNRELLKTHGMSQKETAESFISIIGVDEHGRANDIQHHDVGLIEDLDHMNELNDRVLDSMASGNPDIGLFAAHYEFFSDPSFTSSELTNEIGVHVGDGGSTA